MVPVPVPEGVNVVVAMPLLVTADDGETVPPVAVKVTGVPSGTVPDAAVTAAPFEWYVRFALMVEVPPVVIVAGDAAMPRTSHVGAVTPPPISEDDGPLLVPHQLSDASGEPLYE